MTKKKSIYSGCYALMEKLPPREDSDYPEKFREALIALAKFHGVEFEEMTDATESLARLAVVLAQMHVPAFSARAGRPRTRQRLWKARRQLLKEVEKSKLSISQVCKNLAGRWSRIPRDNPYIDTHKKLSAPFLRKELLLAREERKADMEIFYNYAASGVWLQD